MEQLKILPLVALISGMMVGCGGGDGGGKGGASAAKTTFTFNFAIPATLTESEAQANNCTIYDRFTAENGDKTVLTYSAASKGQVTNYVRGYYSDSDGKTTGDIIIPTTDSFRFNLEDIPDGGFITFQSLEFNGREVRVNTFSKQFLQDKKLIKSTFALNRDSLNKCFTGGNVSEQVFTNLAYRNAVSGGGDYNFVSQKDIFTSPNADMLSTDELPGIAGEPTVLFQYEAGSNNNSLYQYGVGSWETGEVLLVPTDTLSSIYSSSNYNYDFLHVGLIANGFAYNALELDQTAQVYNRPSATNNEKWVYQASAHDTSNGWDSLLNENIPAGWDLDVDPGSYLDIDTLLNEKPNVFSQGESESVIDLDMGFTSSTEGFSRVAYFSASTDYTITHRIFTKSDSDFVIVPELHYYNFPSSVVDELKVSDADNFNRTAIVFGEGTKIDSKTFVSFFSNGAVSEPELDADLDGILTSEKQQMKNEVTLRGSNSLVVSRFN